MEKRSQKKLPLNDAVLDGRESAAQLLGIGKRTLDSLIALG
jgi:hypothetical protein